MSCIYTYKGQEFKTKEDVIKFIKATKVSPTKINFDREVAFKPVSAFTTVQEEEITLTLAAAIFKNAKKDIENLASIDFTNAISKYIRDKAKKHKNDAYNDRYIELSKHIPHFVDKVKKWYKTKGIEIVEELNEDENGNQFTENTLLIDPKQNASAKIRSLISLIPKYTRNINGRMVEDKDTFLGEPKFVSESAMWNTLKEGLADIANPTFEKMEKKLEEMSVFNPSMARLKENLNKKIENPRTGKVEVDENLRTQFYNVFALNRVEYMSVLLDGDPGTGMSVKVSATDPSSQQAMLVRTWAENFAFLLSKVTQSVGKDSYYYSPEKLRTALDKYDSVREKIEKEVKTLNKKNIKNTESARGRQSEKTTEALKHDLLTALKSFGIDMDINGLNHVLRSEQAFQSEDSSSQVGKSLTAFQLNKLFGRNGLKFLIDELEKIHKNATTKDKTGKLNKVFTLNKEEKTVLEDNKIVKLLAKRQGQMLENLTESNTLGAEGNLYSNYTTHNLMSSLINDWNQDINTMDTVTNSVHGRGTRFGAWMKRDPENNKLKAFILNNFKALGKGDQGDKVSKLSDPELLGAYLNITLSDGKIATTMGLAEADKNRQVALKGGDFESSGLNYYEDGSTIQKRYVLANDNASDILLDYFADEVFRMQAIYRDLNGDTAIPENQRVSYLHDPKNTYTSYLFPQFNIKDENNITPLEKFGIVNKLINDKGEIIGYRPVATLTREHLQENMELRKAVELSFLNAVAGDVATFVNNGIIERDTLTHPETQAKLYRFKNIGIDKNVINARYKGNVVEAIADFTLNSIIGSIETTKLFTGDPASYASVENDSFKDFRKRIPAITAGGIKARVYKVDGKWEVAPTYTSAVVENIIAPSEYFFQGEDSDGKPVPNEELLSNMVEAFNEGKEKEEEKATKEDMFELISNYSKVNATDAQAWITLDLFKQRLKSFGKWSDDHQDAYDRMTAKRPILLAKDVKLFAQPLKTVHIEEQTVGVHRYLHYNKQSEAVIIPGLFPGLDALQASSPDVNHFITLDGKKMGASGISKINDKFEVLPQDEIKLNPIKLKTDRLYLQQDLPTKQIKDTLVGSQVVKNLLGEIVLEGDYTIPLAGGKSIVKKGKEVIAEYHQVVGMLSDMGSEQLVQEFGFNEETGMIDQEKFNNFLVEAMEEELTNADILALESGLTIDSLPSLRKKLESKLMAAVAKKAIKLKQLGGAMIQMSAFGTVNKASRLDTKIKNNILWFKDAREGLKPMRLEKDKDTGKLYTEKAQVLLPHKLIIDLIGERYKDMTPAQLKEIIPPDVLMGISYRIPNQATASNDLFEIVGILPPEAGDTIISYNEITTKTGSDFDIDKAFVIVPNVEMDKKTGKLRRPRYAYEFTSDEEAYEEKWEKDWSKSIRAREITNEIEESFKEKKEQIISQIKELKGSKAVVQSLRDIAPNSEESEATTSDVIELIARYFDSQSHSVEDAGEALSSAWSALYKEGIADLKRERKNRDKMLSLKANLNKINKKVRARVKAQLLEEGTIPTIEKFSKLSTNEKHTRAALENYRLDLMQALLGDPKTYPSAVASLDNDTLKDAAKELYEPTMVQRNLHFWKGTTQAKTKTLFDKAKNLVGVIANQMTDHKVTQAFELVYNNIDFGIGKTIDNESLVSAVTDTNGKQTSTWLNLYMNAIVDAAKDPFIVKANINQFTAPVAFMLIRSGVPIEWVNAYIGQPVLQELVQLKSVREGRFAQKVYDQKTGKKLTPEQELTMRYMKRAGVSAEQLKKIGFKNLKNITTKKLKSEVQKAESATAATQLMVLETFNKFKDVSKDLTDTIRASKADVNNGKDLMQAELKEAKLMAVIKKNTIKNIEKKFGATVSEEVEENSGGIVHKNGFIDIDGSAMAGTFHRNGIQLPAKMFSGQTVMSTNAIKSLLFSTIFDLNPELINREKSIDAISNEIYSFIMGLESANITNGKIESLFFGENSVPRKLEKYKNENPDIVSNNIFLRDLSISYRMKEGDPDFVIFNNKSEDRELYQRAWAELFELNPELAGELVNYSYSASGFNRNLFSFFQHIPTEELVNRGVGDFMINLKKAFSETTLLEHGKEQIIRHLSSNPAVVTTVGPRDMKRLNKSIPVQAAFLLEELDEYLIGKDIFGAKETARWLRDSNDNLFKLWGYTDKGAVYVAVSKRGYYSKGKIIKEYFTPNNSLTAETEEEATPKQSVSIVSGNYSKETAPQNPDVGYVFTENLQARLSVKKNTGVKTGMTTAEGIPDDVRPRLNVTTKDNLSGIRTTQKGIINRNALGIVTKKYQQYREGKELKWSYAEGMFKDTDADFALFKEANEEVFEEMAQFGSLVFPKGFATNKAKLPLRFAKWLQDNLLERFGLETELSITKHGSKKFFAGLVSKNVKIEESADAKGTIITKNKELLIAKATEDFYSGSIPAVTAPIGKYRGAIAAWRNENSLVDFGSVVDPLQASILARAEKDTGITKKDIEEAKKNCKF